MDVWDVGRELYDLEATAFFGRASSECDLALGFSVHYPQEVSALESTTPTSANTHFEGRRSTSITTPRAPVT